LGNSVVEVRPLEHGAEDGPDAEAPDRLLQPAAEGHLVVEDGRGVAALEMQARDTGADHPDVDADLVGTGGGRPGDLGQPELGQGVRH